MSRIVARIALAGGMTRRSVSKTGAPAVRASFYAQSVPTGRFESRDGRAWKASAPMRETLGAGKSFHTIGRPKGLISPCFIAGAVTAKLKRSSRFLMNINHIDAALSSAFRAI